MHCLCAALTVAAVRAEKMWNVNESWSVFAEAMCALSGENHSRRDERMRKKCYYCIGEEERSGT